VEDQSKPFDCACWLEEPWEENTELEAVIQTERPKLLSGEKKPGRNDLCPCSSGMKFKKCCIEKFKSS
jgi:uncharacterized protein YecA (UPF0149 family)